MSTPVEATSADTAAIFGAAPSAPMIPMVDAPGTAPIPAPAVDPAAIKHVEEKAKKLVAPRKFDVKAKTEAGINYAAAFLLFCRGMSLQEIADEFGMRYGGLLDRARSEDWERLAKKSGMLVPPPPRPEVAPVSAEIVERRQMAILANREESAALATDLRKDIRKVLTAYQADNAFLRPDDILTLAKAEKILQEVSMTALGDEYVSRAPVGGGNGGGMSPIIINLPAAVSAPRLPRQVTSERDPDDPHTTPVEEPDAIEEVHVVGVRDGEREAVAAKTKRGHTVNFDVLANVSSSQANPVQDGK